MKTSRSRQNLPFFWILNVCFFLSYCKIANKKCSLFWYCGSRMTIIIIVRTVIVPFFCLSTSLTSTTQSSSHTYTLHNMYLRDPSYFHYVKIERKRDEKKNEYINQLTWFCRNWNENRSQFRSFLSPLITSFHYEEEATFLFRFNAYFLGDYLSVVCFFLLIFFLSSSFWGLGVFFSLCRHIESISSVCWMGQRQRKRRWVAERSIITSFHCYSPPDEYTH